MTTFLLIVTCLTLAAAVAIQFARLQKLSLKLAEYSRITDVEGHIVSLQKERDSLSGEKAKLKARIEELKRAHAQYAEVVGLCRSAAEAKGVLDAVKAEIAAFNPHLPAIRAAAEASANRAALQAETERLRRQLVSLADDIAMEEVGLYLRRYDFDDPESFKSTINACVARQKDMVRDGTACVCRLNWVVEGSEEKGRKMAQEQVKLMLRAFNGECDAAISCAKATNFPSLSKRIQKSYEATNKLGATKQVEISVPYYQLKLDELQLTYEMELKKQENRQKQREARQQMEDEARAEREIEEAKRKAEAEEKATGRALDLARRQLAEEHGRHNDKLQQLVAKLETELSLALDRKAKAIARAQLTKSGHVYVLSNIGTFGKDVYKIGMTRRLEPLVRVDELGDASVPFPFDVHAMIYCENAPELECALHSHFADRRVNLVNTRKEFFQVSMDEIQQAVAKLHGQITLLLEPPAPEYRESLAIRLKQQPMNSIPTSEVA